MMIPTLHTTRLILRPFNAGDWGAVNAMLTDPDTTRYMHFGRWTEEQRRSWFDWSVDAATQPITDSIQWIIATKETGEAIGWFGIGASSDPEVDGDNSFGYLLARSHWNRGYMTEALLAVFAFEFDTLGAPRLTATCDVENPASARVMEKAGMTRVKTEYGADFEGNMAHRHHYAITRAEYERIMPGSHRRPFVGRALRGPPRGDRGGSPLRRNGGCHTDTCASQPTRRNT